MQNTNTLLSQFCYFVTSLGNEPLLKSEISFKFPTWKLSFSGPGLITYKIEQGLSWAQICQLSLTYALSYGAALGKIEKELHISEEDKKSVLSFWHIAEIDQIPGKKITQGESLEAHFPIKEFVQSKNQYLTGLSPYKPHESFISPLPHEFKSSVKLADTAPSRAHDKIMEAFYLAGCLPKKGDKVLDLGCAPGGASSYFLSFGAQVEGLDPGEMAPEILANPLFTHLKCGLQDYRIENNQIYHWIACDINLDPFSIIKELKRLFHFINNKQLYGFFFTIKHTRNFRPFPKGISDLQKQIEGLYQENKISFKKIVCRQLPSNKNEFILMVLH